MPWSAKRQKQLDQARQAFDWPAAGSSPVQQRALRDFDRAVAGFSDGVYRRPSWRRKHLDEGYCIRDSRVEIVNRKLAQGFVPTLGLVKFRLSRALPAGKLGMARGTCKSGRWHVSFPAAQPAVPGAPPKSAWPASTGRHDECAHRGQLHEKGFASVHHSWSPFDCP
ncbi:MAG: hypothetical protein K0U84_06850 [Actinomycetia bacterium]|nr:hypothetical protein [Actinomycetes bacterium]